jgi:hypothetical protein
VGPKASSSPRSPGSTPPAPAESPHHLQGLTADVPGFLTPPPEADPLAGHPLFQPADPESASGSPRPGNDGPSDASPTSTTTSPGQSPASTGDAAAAARIDREALAKALATVIRVVTAILHRRLGPSHPVLRELWVDEEVWKADAEDIREISQPAARLIARRLRVPADAADGLAVLVATGGWADKNLDKDARIRGHAAQLEQIAPEERTDS